MDRPIDQIRAATSAAHQRLEELPYARSVLDGSLPIERYGSFLRAIHIVHEALEQAIELSGDAELRQVFGRAFERRALLEQDLAYLGLDLHGVDYASLQAAVLAQRIRLGLLRDPRQLLGHAYVLEGSQLGGLVQRAALAHRPELKQGGLAYLTGIGKGTQGAFEAFVERLERALPDQPAIESAIAGALEAFTGLRAVLEALDPGINHRRWLVAELNPEAGTHSVPDDAREVAAALRAGEHTWHRYAYYDARYGERGLRFTRSDSAWLVTLAREDAQQAQRHVSWLARVLAARGMPRRLLEEHLAHLHAALVDTLPQRATHYQPLMLAAEHLRKERIEVMSEERTRALIEAHGAGLADEAGVSPKEAATLAVAAVADEKRGIANAVTSLSEWLTCRERFSKPWVAALERTLALARS